jgi:N12 class adenine-specific DNA methylase
MSKKSKTPAPTPEIDPAMRILVAKILNDLMESGEIEIEVDDKIAVEAAKKTVEKTVDLLRRSMENKVLEMQARIDDITKRLDEHLASFAP